MPLRNPRCDGPRSSAVRSGALASIVAVDRALVGKLWRGDRLTAEVFLNVSNLLDRDPPRAAAFVFTGSSYTNTQLFDIYGRQYTLGARVQF